MHSDSGERTKDGDAPNTLTESQNRILSSRQSIGVASLESLGYNKFDTDEDYEEFNLEHYPGAERTEYDFTSERQHMFTTNILESAAHLIKGCLGAGILAMHQAYMYGGLWTSFGLTFLIGFIAPFNMLILVSSAQKLYVKMRIPKMSFPDLAEAAVVFAPIRGCRKYRKAMRFTVEVLLFIEQCGACCIYQIMMASTLKQVLEKLVPAFHTLKLNLRIYILMATVPILLLCSIRNLKYLAPFSIASDIFILICILMTLYYSMSAAGPISERPAWKSLDGLVHLCGILVYSIDCTGLVLSIENNMRYPTYFSTVIWIGMFVVIPCVTIVGFFGYWGWGDKCTSPIMLNMPAETAPLVLQCFVVLVMAVTFSVHFWVPFRIAWRKLGKNKYRKRILWETFYRYVHVGIITICSIIYPNHVELMTVLGLVFISILAFVFPPLINCLVFWRDRDREYRRLKAFRNLVSLVFGLTVCIGGLICLIISWL